ncbi:hypothetical protein MYP_160 [Sporocytophaga myxococcoides]|uniref:Peptidoglycan-associated lipoprotein n=2 Tax=Sporocytophaga myxococcoides TaxID=153721 RepID=A0A098L9A1_9BACT|nr:hypothetical protein MYP_160 [Sporocytophaga myxococcoides]
MYKIMSLLTRIGSLILLYSMIQSYTASGQSILARADRNYNQFNYSLAVKEYEVIAEKKGQSVEIVQKIADCYRKMNKSEEAEKWYAVLLTKFSRVEPSNLLYYAEALRNNGDYQEARKQYIQFGKMFPSEKKMADAFARNCEKAMEWMSNPVQVKIENVKSVNTVYSEFSPLLIENKLILATDRKFDDTDYSNKQIYGWTGTPFLNLAFAEIDTNFKIEFKNKLKGVNGMYHNGPATFSKKGDTIYFTRTNKVSNRGKINGQKKGPDFVNRLEIYYSVKKNGTWSAILPFEYNNILNYSVGHPALSPDGKTLYFVSDMPGSMGQTDIYFCTMEANGKWSFPKNAGKYVNTPAKEVFPYIAPDGKLYFSSNGHTGLGGLDMFVTSGKYDKWDKPENLMYPMNSPKDDFGITLDTTMNGGFFSSNREGGMGEDDIYKFSNPTCVLAGLTLHLVDNSERPLENVLVKLYKMGDTANVIAYERTFGQPAKKICLRSYEPCAIVKNPEGKFFFKLQPGAKYELKLAKNNYFSHSTTIEAKCNTEDTMNIAIQLKEIEIDKPIILKDVFFNDQDKLFVIRNIYYDLDKSEIRYDAALELDKLVEVLRENPNIKMELSAHTDSRHSEEYNMKLSQKRAEAAVQYIVSKGIPSDVIVAKGYGESKIMNHCKDGVNCKEEEHQYNRRTEIKVTEIMEPEVHRVGPYDTLETISKVYGVSVENLKKLNNLEEDTITAGMKIKLK